jgi:lycopene cyclase domain-containing protein
MKTVYLLINFFAVIVPLVFSFHHKIKFDKKWKYFFPANFIAAVILICWDIIFTRLGVWHFNERYVTGIYFFNLPLEEVLFFFCIPFACVFTYHCLEHYLPAWKKKTENLISLLLSIILIATGLVYCERLYTFACLTSTGLFCFLLQFVWKVKWFGKSLSVYVVLLVPFMIINGMLTGTGLSEPVVIYNNAETLGIRLLTIPVEDVFYGFELFLLNLFFYNGLTSRSWPESS